MRTVALVHRAVQIGKEVANAVAVSSDSSDIRYEGNRSGANYLLHRPAELATDEAPMLGVAQHAAQCLKFDVLLILQPTQPLRKPEHITAALEILEATGADSVVSVVQIPAHYSPDYAVGIERGRLAALVDRACEADYCPRAEARPAYEHITRRQDARPAYSRDGTVYAIRRQTIEAGSLYGSHCVPLVIPAHESVNLDTEDDWTRAEAMVKR
jgi:CMP-N-acetylneuraminic acid synthetase